MLEPVWESRMDLWAEPMLAIRWKKKTPKLNRSTTITKVELGPHISNWKGGQGRLSTELPSEIWAIQSASGGLGPTSWGCKSQENLLVLQVPDGLSSEMMSDDLYLVPWVPGTLGNKRLHCLDNRNLNAASAICGKFVFLKEICILTACRQCSECPLPSSPRLQPVFGMWCWTQRGYISVL